MSARRRPRIARPVRSARLARTGPTILAAGTAALGLLAVTACGLGGGTGDDGKGGALEVVASFYPMEFLAERIGGDHVSVTTLTEPGVEPHDLEISPQQTAELTEADVVVYLKGLQAAVDDAVEQSGVEHIAEATSFTALERHDGAADPHIWLDPVKYAEAAEGVGDVLAEADPDHAATYERNAGRLADELHALDGEFRQGLAGTRTGTFITTHAAFGYLAERYGLRQEAITGLDPETEPSAERMRELHDIAEAEDVGTVFFETLASDETARTLAGDLGLRTGVLDPVEGITEDSPGDDYFSVMRANLQALAEALGAR